MNHSKWGQIGSRNPGGNGGCCVLQELEGLISKVGLVDPPDGIVLCLQIYICKSPIGHSSNLALDVSLESSYELYHQGLGVHISSVRDQGLEAVQVIIYYPVFLVVGQSFQGVYSIHFCVN